ncbi:protein kinase [Streptomyces sp. NPDC051940]|uniref:protein kinase domain-containing protein n=1 Tax=Streptomyces sp. NPDC051940 TaxID=3155675 RepID=UPI00342D836C
MSGSRSLPLLPDDPDRLGRYWLAARLGAGGQGVVYEAYDDAGHRVAVKALRPALAAADGMRDRLAREVRAARQVAAFCTARVLDADLDGPRPYIVSEYVPGPSLRQAVERDGPLEGAALHRVALGIATALAAVHAAGVVHRDLKPDNVLLADGPRVIDFGIARTDDMTRTETGVMVGTPSYMAPETVTGGRAGPAADIFAWGAVVLYAATGEDPFRGASAMESALRVVSEDPDLGVLPEDLRAQAARALAKDPAERPSATDLLTGLLGLQGSAITPHEGFGPPRFSRFTEATKDLRRREDGPDPRMPDPAGAAPVDPLPGPAVDLPAMAAAAQAAAGPLLPRSTAADDPVLGERAEEVYAALDPSSREAVRELLLRLVAPGTEPDGSEDAIRAVGEEEVLAGRTEHESAALAHALRSFEAVGVLRRSGGRIRLAAPALPRAWPRLRRWVDLDRAALRERLRLLESARGWDTAGRTPEHLLTGTGLRAAAAFVQSAPRHLRSSELERTYLAAAQTAQTRRRRRVRQVRAGVALAVVLTLLGFIALQQFNNSRLADERDRAEKQARAANLASLASALRLDDSQAVQLFSVAAWRQFESYESESALLTTLGQLPYQARRLPGGADPRGVRVTQSGGDVLLGDEDFTLWDAGTGERFDVVTAARDAGLKGLADLSTDPDTNDPSPAMTPDGRVFAAVTGDGMLEAVDMGSRNPAFESFEVGKGILRDLAPGARYAVVQRGDDVFAEQAEVDVWDTATGRRSGPFRAGSDNPPAVSPDGRYLVDCTRDPAGGVVTRAWSVATRKPALRDAVAGVGCERPVFSPDGRWLALTDLETVVVDLSAEGAGARSSPFEKYSVDTVVFSEDSRYLASLGASQLGLARPGEAKAYFTYPFGSDDERLESVGIGPRGGYLRAATDTGRLVTIPVDAPQDVVPADPPVEVLAASPVSGLAAVRPRSVESEAEGSERPTAIGVRDTDDGASVGSPLDVLGCTCVDQVGAFSANGRYLAYGGTSAQEEYSITVRDVRADRTVEEPVVYGPDGAGVRDVAVSSDGRTLVATVETEDGAERSLKTWKSPYSRYGADEPEIKADREDRNVSGSVAMSPDDRWVVTSSGVLVQLDSGLIRRDVFGNEPIRAMAFADDSARLALARVSGAVDVYDTGTWRRLQTLPAAAHEGGDVEESEGHGLLDFSPDGSTLAELRDGAVQLWDLAAGRTLGPTLALSGAALETTDLAFSRDGASIVLFGGSALAYRLAIAPEKVADAICERLLGQHGGRAGLDRYVADMWRRYIPDQPQVEVCPGPGRRD